MLFESGALGPTGVSWQQALNGEIPGSSVDGQVFSGVRFELTQATITSQIGGHFFSPSGGTFFGAIVKLEDEHDFPNSDDLSTPDVLGTTQLTFPMPSNVAFGDLSVVLDPGWYALVFGSGLFGANGTGGMPLNNPDIGNPTYISFQPGSVTGWNDLSNPRWHDFRFVVVGNRVVPEPRSIVGIAFLSFLFAMCRHSKRLC
ncbi:MAG: hypothetical protein KDA44_06070 [Planctomycetales bacterium]|nr:hypothetical protein [Planctomycetales bacterium]